MFHKCLNSFATLLQNLNLKMVIYSILLILIVSLTECSIIVVDENTTFCSPASIHSEGAEVSSLKNSYICSGIEHVSQIEHSVPLNVEEIIIINSTIYPEKRMSKESQFLSVTSIEIIASFISASALKWLESLINLEHLNLLNSSTSYIINSEDDNITVLDLEIRALKSLQSLRISGSNITNLGVKKQSDLPYLDLSDNNFDCSRDFIWLLELHDSRNVPLNNTKCFLEKIVKTHSYNPIGYTLKQKSFTLVQYYKKESRDNCPPKCVCILSGMAPFDRPQLNVECIGLNMTKIPDVIPKDTAKCNFTFNLIEDLTPMLFNPLYDKVSMMSLSHNRISFLDPIHFPEWLAKRRDVGFSLNHNRLQKFPAAAIKKIYESPDKIAYMPQFYLAHNPWVCSCDYIADFQDLIYHNMYYIIDLEEIRCSPTDEYNPRALVAVLHVDSLCSPNVKVDTWDVVNIMLALLLIVLICDFFYNWRQYKKKGKLPWIVTKFKC